MPFNFLKTDGRTAMVASCDICGKILKHGSSIVHIQKDMQNNQKAVPVTTCKGKCDVVFCELVGHKTSWHELGEIVFQLAENTKSNIDEIRKTRNEIGYIE